MIKDRTVRLSVAAFAVLFSGFAAAQSFTGTLTSSDGKSKMEITATVSGVVVPPPVDPPPVIPPVEPPPAVSGDIPLVYDDARFSANTTSGPVVIANNGYLGNRSITQTGSEASIKGLGAFTLEKVRVNSREAVRVAGSGLITITNSYLEARGQGSDHADTLQVYASGRNGTIRLRNTSIVAHNTAATAGFFIADNWRGTVDFQNVVFNGGPFGLRLHSDTSGDIRVIMKDVFFVGPFGSAPFYFLNYGGKRVIIDQWDNVRHATIVNGKLVPGALIPSP